MPANKLIRHQEFQNSKKIEELESIRGLAAILVVLFHLPKWNSIMDIRFFNNGYLMVPLFFVLSGFVIYNAYSDKIQVKKDLFKFQFLRFGRLYPVHITFLLAFLFIEIIKYIVYVFFDVKNSISTPFEINSFSQFIKNLFLISSVLPNQILSYNIPAWSIGVEFYTYFIFGLSVLFIRKGISLLFLIITTCSFLMLAMKMTFGFEPLLSCFAGFFMGCLTAIITSKYKIILSKYSSLYIFLSIIIFLQIKNDKDFDIVIYFLTAAFIISIILSSDGMLKKILKFHVLSFLGGISYSVYMSHMLVIIVFNKVLKIFLKRPQILDLDGNSVVQLSQVEALLGCFFVIILVLVVSTFVYNFIEKPMRTKSRLFSSSRLS
jgi:peptidoglycan/LPS O-acetylase OafA/YrhL